MNSVMQCLYHTCTLAERLKKLENDKTLGRVLMATVKVMADLHYHRNMRESITHLKRVVGQKDSVYRDSEQKEAHDFLCQMLVWLDEDTTLSSKEGEEAEKNGKRVSFIASLFHGTHLSTITCEKEPKVDIITNEESFSNLSLTLTRPTTLQEALKQYYQPQGLEWDCDRCHTEHDCQHKISLTKAPPVLVLHLNRSSASPNSEHKLRVRYPLDLVVDVNSAGSSKRYYSLFAVCCHSGTMHSGHYTALCRTGEQWYHFNDTHVSPIALEDVLHKPAAHILFYEAKE
ncbi:Ubiquitin carboxyl-terminal hydrolase 2 [Chionoecetes opilio]|uniref:ubiquitinyl hydrolase 1 n=1 Tax=Chionoecetes opilio TaxID=41210 RepID=A0A8J4Y766_CHIOP|nr:Ubiquitin carboxyl-terminal hydrolase 2 [Chionoecetes opilio]